MEMLSCLYKVIEFPKKQVRRSLVGASSVLSRNITLVHITRREQTGANDFLIEIEGL